MSDEVKITYRTIQDLARAMNLVGYKYRDEMITGQWEFSKVPYFNGEPIESLNIRFIDRLIEEDLSYFCDGERHSFVLQRAPESKDKIFLFLNGLYRNDYELSGNEVIFPFSPLEGSILVIKYLVGGETLPSDPSMMERMLSFIDAFIRTENILTHNYDVVTYYGNYIEVDI